MPDESTAAVPSSDAGAGDFDPEDDRFDPEDDRPDPEGDHDAGGDDDFDAAGEPSDGDGDEDLDPGNDSSDTDDGHSDLDHDRFTRLDGAEYDRVTEFLKDRVSFTAREWAVTRLCADFRTKTGVEMTNVGEHLPELVPFMDESYSRQAVYQARHDFESKVRRAGATFLYGAFGDFFTAEEVDDLLFEATETAKFLLEVEGASLSYDDEVAAEDRLRAAMRAVHEASTEHRYDRCPHCGERLGGGSTEVGSGEDSADDDAGENATDSDSDEKATDSGAGDGTA